VKLSVAELREIVRESIDCWGGSRPEETYDQELVDDPCFKQRSVYVPDDIKDLIVKWMHAMGLAGTKKPRRSS